MRRLGLLGGSLLLACSGCNEVTTGGSEPDPDQPLPPVVEAPQAIVAEKVDLVFVVDNSMSMADKQAVLATSAVRLVRDLTNPPCLDANGDRLPELQQPASPAEACPAGAARAASPVTDLRVGVISSSLGALTAAQCDGGASADPPDNDGARLLTRGPGGVVVPTYQDLGFLAWDPASIQTPPGDTNIDDFEEKLSALIVGVGQVGCGYEMPLEAMARFLVDPEPYQTVATDPSGSLVRQGVDTVLLEQRAAFLRPDSLVSVVLLSDENDCSVDVGSQGYLVLGPESFYKSTSVCQLDPNDACCTSCALAPPPGCAPDPSCGEQGTAHAARYDTGEDHPNTRCWDQKRRYGVDFRYPVARYTNALTQPLIDPSQPDLAASGQGVPNPLFVGGRPVELVSLTTIVGVPWQDVAADPTNPQSRVKTTSQMESDGSWAWLVEGGDPFMREAALPRTGVNPATGEDVASMNGINGGDRTIGENEDLQYTCIFGLETPATDGPDCSNCVDASCDDPLCVGQTQVAAKAYPGVRQLSVVRSLGDRGIAGSICPGDVASATPGGPSVRSPGYEPPIVELESRMWKYLPRE